MQTLIWLIWLALALVWLFMPTGIILYRRLIVPRRLEEVEDLFDRECPSGKTPIEGERGKSAAYHYARLLDPDDPCEEPNRRLKYEFDRFHSIRRYIFPTILISASSGLIAMYTGFWLVSQLRVQASPSISLRTDTNSVAMSATERPPSPAMAASASATAEPSRRAPPSRVQSTILMALWGAMVWSMYELLSRRRSGDLTPTELYEIALRLMTAVPTGWAASLLAFDTVPGLLAFAVSAFPLRDVRQVFRKSSLQRVGGAAAPVASATSAARALQGNIGQVVSGVGDDTVIRLEELGIVTHQDLAYADPLHLMIQTGVPLRLVLAWIDKALLAVYAAPHINELLKLGIPCALDACEFYTKHCYDLATEKERDWRADRAVQELACKLGVPVEILVPQMLHSLFADPHTQFLIRAWFGPATNKADM